MMNSILETLDLSLGLFGYAPHGRQLERRRAGVAIEVVILLVDAATA